MSGGEPGATASPRLWVVLPCAGRGTRFAANLSGNSAVDFSPAESSCVDFAPFEDASDTPKQYATIGGRAVLTIVLERMLALQPEQIVLVVANDDDRWRCCVPTAGNTLVTSAIGGGHRAASVLNGLDALAVLAGPDDWVLVHDVARPCVQLADCRRLLQTVDGTTVGGLLALPVADTLKRAGSDEAGASYVHATVAREHMWFAQTPQVFRYALLRSALRQAQAQGVAVTDEASAIEHAGMRPMLVRGSPDNLKITWPEDLARASCILARQARSA